ncbi:hypothetical protein RGU12_08055 [Fredinandcohnia sp. QZ13]|uniref:hypothetical protein n=1 Tax=Fredinandcohnia sp. QZ13 TaxID=3073144 RepID=UPI00285356E7|nr:hypothetical protein [Fredinandcohnia sp. QZ13]MDR4887514.1 hypothetical protein [Fredinandcohnia sp. QZ13]
MHSNEKLERPVLEKKVIQMYVMEKLGAPTIGKELGISKTEVYRILESNNIDRRQRKSLVAQKIIELYEQKMSIYELCEHFGLQEKTIKIIISQSESENA